MGMDFSVKGPCVIFGYGDKEQRPAVKKGPYPGGFSDRTSREGRILSRADTSSSRLRSNVLVVSRYHPRSAFFGSPLALVDFPDCGIKTNPGFPPVGIGKIGALATGELCRNSQVIAVLGDVQKGGMFLQT